MLTKAFEKILILPHIDAQIKVALIEQLSQASVHQGMVVVQKLDIHRHNEQISLLILVSIHIPNTGALLQLLLDDASIITYIRPPTTQPLIPCSQHLYSIC
ncbi:polyprenyl synthetase family protein, partial [Staphylococcus pseudintermedius]